jgi:1,2-diacylglycerol 3-alpha-glucosyltransferase
MNIGFFTECWDPQINGVLTSMKNLQFELTRRNNSIYIFAPRYKNYQDTDPSIFRQCAVKYIFQPEFNFASLLKYKALRAARRHKLDLIHSHTEFSLGIIGARVARSLMLPFVMTFHTFWEYYSHYFMWDLLPQNLFKYILRLLYKSTNYFIAPSQKVKSYLKNEMRVSAPVEVIPTGLDLDHFFQYNVTPRMKQEFRHKYGLAKEDIVMLFVGRVGKEKSIDVLIRGLPAIKKKYPRIRLLVVGDGPGRSSLKKLARRMGVKQEVVFTGYIPWKHIPLVYKSSDVFTLASVSETQGLVTVEALASGLPVIVRDDPANLDIIEHGRYGLIFKTPGDFARSVHTLLGNPGLRLGLQKKAQDASLKYSLEEFGKKVTEYYNWIIEDHMAKK